LIPLASMVINILAGIDLRSFSQLVTYQINEPVYSHDLNTLQLVSEALNAGHKCFLTANTESHEKIYNVSKSNNIMSFDEIRSIESIDLLVYSGVDNFLIAKRFPSIKTLVMQSALNFVEEAQTAKPIWPKLVIEGLRKHTHYIVVQNDHMKNLADVLFSLMAGWKNPDRILVYPQAPRYKLIDKYAGEVNQIRKNIRDELKIPENATVIINAGGVWRWTALDEFLRQFADMMQNGDHNIFFIQPGFAQNGNHDHDGYIEEINSYISNLDIKIKEKIILIESWMQIRTKLEHLLIASDFGLNLNPDTLENWQSHRVRVLEYISAGLPTFIYNDDSYSTAVPDFFVKLELNKNEMFRENILDAIDKLALNYFDTPRQIIQMRYSISNSYKKLVDSLEEIVKRDSTPNMETESLIDLDGNDSNYILKASREKLKSIVFRYPMVMKFVNKFGLIKIYNRMRIFHRRKRR
jgi:hypothetical protein